MSKIDLVRDVLDKQMLDRNDCELGRVDGIVLEFPENGRPRVAQLQMGGSVLAARVGNWATGPVRSIAKRFGPRRLSPVKFPWSKVTKLGRDVHLDVDAKQTAALAWEEWIDKNIIDKVPGAKSK
ncbi:MAG TPA: hypothetical protein VM099_15710 [Gemmatimonadaceae bacterium]|nr:hypothetical protein [Gemmatimonadaceae bacterium]